MTITCPVCHRDFDVAVMFADGQKHEVPIVGELVFGIHGPIQVCMNCMDVVVDLPDSTRKAISAEVDRYPPLIAGILRQYVKTLVLH
jgi:hypothetical protein